MDLNQLLSSLSAEDMAKLQTAATGLLNNINTENSLGEKSEPTKSAEKNATPSELESALLKPSALSALGKLINADDDRIRFIEALKPLLSEQRREKADEAEKMLKLMSALPALKDSGLLKGFI